MKDPFEHIISTKAASKLWGLNQDSIKRLARQKKIISRKLDPTDSNSPYLIYKDQPNPSHNNLDEKSDT